MAKTVVGLLDSYQEAEKVIQDLVNSGFKREAISMIRKGDTGETQEEGDGGKTAKGAVKGAGAGAAVGGVAGLLIGLTGLALPGIGPIIAAGPLASALAGAGVGAAAGGIIGGLTKMGVPEEHAQYYAEGVRRGGVLITVITDDAAAARAAEILRRHGAVDIEKRAAQWRATGWSRFDEKAAPYTAEERAREREAVLPVVEEEVKIGKREVPKGAVRVYTHVTEAPVEEEVTLREERATVERRPADRPATAEEQEAFRETSIEIQETEEEPVVAKQARVKEEVVVGKETAERTETIREKVRRTDVEVEQQGKGTTMHDTDDEDFQEHFRSSRAGMGESYEAYRPAYHYAGTLWQNKRYQGREWAEVEEDVRSDWEKEHPGTWSKFRDAIRYGWERITRPAESGRR